MHKPAPLALDRRSDTVVAPLVSIVMATYNRSNLLPFSIGALLRGTYQSWELIVVGDCCSDDTADVVAGFNDPRISYFNLAENFGEQTGPSNFGVERATGRYLAFLNHDDMWLPDHLQRSVAFLEAHAEVQLVFGQGLVINEVEPHDMTGALCGQRQCYAPWMVVPASLWVMRRALAEQVGPWKPSWKIRVAPSQEWLHRAHRQKVKIVADPDLSAVLIQSGRRLNSYRDRQDSEHRYWYQAIVDERLLRQAMTSMLGSSLSERAVDFSGCVKNLAALLVRKLLLMLRVWPPSASYWMRFWRKGSFLKRLRQVRGLDVRA